MGAHGSLAVLVSSRSDGLFTNPSFGQQVTLHFIN